MGMEDVLPAGFADIGCGTGCSFAIVADNKTGRPASFPRGGEANMYLDLDYSLESRLLAAEWFSYDAGRCFLSISTLIATHGSH